MAMDDAAEHERFDLVRSFLLASGIVLVLGMGAIGLWVSARIERAVSENAATVAALYVDGVVAPLAQSLRGQSTLDGETRRILDERLQRGLMNRELHSFKVWLPDGTIVYSSNPESVGRKFAVTEGLAAAAAGRVYTEFNDLTGEENSAERAGNIPLLEIYSPIRDARTGDVIAVVEFYDTATELSAELRQARIESWLVVALTTIAMIALLSGIILRGGRLIASQRKTLGEQISRLSSLLAQNRDLRDRADQANRRAAALNERYLRRISAEIHDGPVQHLAFASLRLKPSGKALSAGDRAAVAQALDEAVGELRLISRGLTLPDLEDLSAQDVARRAVKAHQNRAGDHVAMEIREPLPRLSQAENICLYRFIQEGLNNASHHAGGKGLTLGLDVADGNIVARIRDDGPGFDAGAPTGGLGLSGMRERVVGLGGSFRVETSPGGGTVLTAVLPVLDSA